MSVPADSPGSATSINKTYGYKKKTWEKILRRLSLKSGLRIAPWKR